jgi:hypothetical protein
MPAKPQTPADPRAMLEFKNQFVPLPAPPGGPGAGGKPPSMNVSLRLGPKSLGPGAGASPGTPPEIQQMVMQKLQQLPPNVRSMVVRAMMQGRGQGKPPMPQPPAAPPATPAVPPGPGVPQ